MERVNVRRLPDDWSDDDEALLHAIDEATATPIFISYKLAGEWFAGLHAVLEPLHAHASAAADVDAAELASRLIEFAVALDIEVFGSAVTTHGHVLGTAGSRSYQRGGAAPGRRRSSRASGPPRCRCAGRARPAMTGTVVFAGASTSR